VAARCGYETSAAWRSEHRAEWHRYSDGQQEDAMAPEPDVRLVSVNIGVRSTDELEQAARFWEALLERPLEDRTGRGRSRQAMIGRDEHAFFFNLRVRDETEDHHGHRAAFGIAVPDLDAFVDRALELGAIQHYPPTQSDDEPRHCLIHDPVGNRVVIWQR
jgi:predicted enzyme related to lactoylglutathione lyase